ncbi:hypothetical protein BHE74_00009092 [Ensete ventricosum]|nr:hypothetical protein GW17_00009169 [Ensete ventricosum]RWW82450.1 hypothetical protein BHE74_00009092 [Ensete ventricosum]
MGGRSVSYVGPWLNPQPVCSFPLLCFVSGVLAFGSKSNPVRSVGDLGDRLLVFGGAAGVQSLLQCLGGVAYPRSRDLVWSTFVGGASLFACTSFHPSVSSSVVDACTKAVVIAPPTRPLRWLSQRGGLFCVEEESLGTFF